METSDGHTTPSRFWLLFIPALLAVATLVTVQNFQAAGGGSGGNAGLSATYTHGILGLTIPYRAVRDGAGQLTVEVLDPEDHVLGSVARHIDVAQGQGRWLEQIKRGKPFAFRDVRLH